MCFSSLLPSSTAGHMWDAASFPCSLSPESQDGSPLPLDPGLQAMGDTTFLFFNFSCPPAWPPLAPCVSGACEHFLVDFCHSTERRIHRLGASLECCLHVHEEGELLPTPQSPWWGSRDSSALPSIGLDLLPFWQKFSYRIFCTFSYGFVWIILSPSPGRDQWCCGVPVTTVNDYLLSALAV